MHKPEIEMGSMVEIETSPTYGDVLLRAQLERWRRSYQWPMKVSVRLPDHVVLEDSTGKTVHLGSTGNPMFAVGHVKLATSP